VRVTRAERYPPLGKAITPCFTLHGLQSDSRVTHGAHLTAAEAAAEFQAIIAFERTAAPFVYWRDDRGRQLLLALKGDRWRITIGRSVDCDIALTWDAKVSRSHALLERVAGNWTLVDDGLSRNGTYYNGSRIIGRQRLADGDHVDLGRSRVFYRDPMRSDSASTAATDTGAMSPALSPTQRKVLIALCRPLNDSSAATPATNRQIASEVYLTVDAVKFHLRGLCDRFGLSQLPQNQKRARLAHAALAAGLLAPRDF
jgi:hypothetical protein